jgi:hypothetical protein
MLAINVLVEVAEVAGSYEGRLAAITKKLYFGGGDNCSVK